MIPPVPFGRQAAMGARALALLARWAPVLLLALAGTFFAIRVWHGIWFLPFVDESEHLLGGIMLNHGATLYRDFIDAHGPFTFMLTQAYGALFGWADPNFARLISVLLALFTAAAIATTPALAGRAARCWGIALFLGLIASVWLMQALYMVNYHAIAGFLIATGCALFSVPAWRGAPAGKPAACLAGACFALTLATAYSFAPAILLLAASSCWAAGRGPARPALAAFAAGAAAAGLIVIAWLLAFADIVGFVVFHFIINQFVYAKYVSFSLVYFLQGLAPSANPDALVHSLALLCWAVGGAVFLALDFLRPAGARRMAGPILLGFAGLLALCARGGHMFQDGSFLVSSIAMTALCVPALLSRLLPPFPAAAPAYRTALARIAATAAIATPIAAAELTMRHAMSSPWNITRAEMVDYPPSYLGVSDAPLPARMRALTGPADRILIVPYAPDLFLLAGRLPMDKYSVYLPWDAEYARHPWFGRDRDLCVDMGRNPPKLVYFNNWIVWGRYGMAQYAPCFLAILASKYVRQTDFPDLYLLRDASP